MTCQSCWSPDLVARIVVPAHDARMAAYVRDGYRAFRKPKFECSRCEILFLWVCGARENLYVFSLYRFTPDLDERISDGLLTSMAAARAEIVRTSFLFVGNMNGHHQKWLGSTTINRHGLAAFEFATVSGCKQLVVGPTMYVVEQLTS